jgi:uncharacterized protein
MIFEWDKLKDENNIKKHGLSFIKATEIFYNYPRIRIIDKRFDYNEVRYIVIGKTDESIIITLVCTIRKTGLRIISARVAHTKERMKYYDYSKS